MQSKLSILACILTEAPLIPSTSISREIPTALGVISLQFTQRSLKKNVWSFGTPIFSTFSTSADINKSIIVHNGRPLRLILRWETTRFPEAGKCGPGSGRSGCSPAGACSFMLRSSPAGPVPLERLAGSLTRRARSLSRSVVVIETGATMAASARPSSSACTGSGSIRIA